MTSEEIKAIVYYIQGLQALWKEGYNAEKSRSLQLSI